MTATVHIDVLHKSNGLRLETGRWKKYYNVFTATRWASITEKFFVHDELFNFKSLQFVFAVEIFQNGSLPPPPPQFFNLWTLPPDIFL
jgi:hypothetical protein